jgi:3-hydroxy-3-methylglutaryl CoA synthase
MVFSGVIRDKSTYTPVVSKMDFFKEIGERTALTYQQYEDLHERRLAPDKTILDKKAYEGQFVLRSVEGGERHYTIA